MRKMMFGAGPVQIYMNVSVYVGMCMYVCIDTDCDLYEFFNT